jgi:hypothetical protein
MPENEAANIFFDSATRQVLWSVGSISAGEFASMSFQVVITPYAAQKGLPANLISQAVVVAGGRNGPTQATAAQITTALPDDASSGGSVQ